MKKYFSQEDPLDNIIRQTLENRQVIKTKHIVSGWTNIVIEVTTNSGTLFFRFPRNPFWSKMIVKDAKFCNYIDGKTSFYTPQMSLHFDKNERPFSVHKKIEGYTLGDRIYHLSHTALCGAAYDIARFVKELSSIDTSTAPSEVAYPLSKFLKELDDRHFSNHLNTEHQIIKKSEKRPTFVHGDLNLGNILVNDQDQVIGVIDFCFAGISHPNMDISRILSRPTPKAFESQLLKSYKELNNDHLNASHVHKMKEVWQNIDAGYANHIRDYYPEITLPELKG